MAGLPKISIITPSFNQADFLEETILSVLNQRYPNLEYIVLDGGSTDESAQIIRRYESHFAFWTSEKDNGQADALNRGIRMATGDIIAYINSDDTYLPGAFDAVAHEFSQERDWTWLCGEWVNFGPSEASPSAQPQLRAPRTAAQALFYNCFNAQPAIFWQASLFREYGVFEESYPLCFVDEFQVRILHHGQKCLELHRPLASYRFHPGSFSVSVDEKFWKERERIRAQYLPLIPVDEARREETLHRAQELESEAHRLTAAGDWREARGKWLELARLHPASLSSCAVRRNVLWSLVPGPAASIRPALKKWLGRT